MCPVLVRGSLLESRLNLHVSLPAGQVDLGARGCMEPTHTAMSQTRSCRSPTGTTRAAGQEHICTSLATQAVGAVSFSMVFPSLIVEPSGSERH